MSNVDAWSVLEGLPPVSEHTWERMGICIHLPYLQLPDYTQPASDLHSYSVLCTVYYKAGHWGHNTQWNFQQFNYKKIKRITEYERKFIEILYKLYCEKFGCFSVVNSAENKNRKLLILFFIEHHLIINYKKKQIWKANLIHAQLVLC